MWRWLGPNASYPYLVKESSQWHVHCDDLQRAYLSGAPAPMHVQYRWVPASGACSRVSLCRTLANTTLGFIGDSTMQQLYHATLGFLEPNRRVPVEGSYRVTVCDGAVVLLWKRCNRFSARHVARILIDSSVVVLNWGVWYEPDTQHERHMHQLRALLLNHTSTRVYWRTSIAAHAACDGSAPSVAEGALH